MLLRPFENVPSSSTKRLHVFLNFLSFQASGFGSGNDAYDDIEGRDEVKKIVEEREYTMVCNTHALTMHTDTHTHIQPLPLSWPGLAPKKAALILTGPAETGTRQYVPLLASSGAL